MVLSNIVSKNLMPLDQRFYLLISCSAGSRFDTCSRMRGRVNVDIPIHSRDTSRLLPMYFKCDIVFKDAAFSFDLSGKFQVLIDASSCKYIGDREYNHSLSNAGPFVGSQLTAAQKVQLESVGSWKASGERSMLLL